MNSGELYQDYNEEGEPVEGQEPEQSDTITIPVDDLSGAVEPGSTLEVVSVADGIVTLRVIAAEPSPPVSEAAATV